MRARSPHHIAEASEEGVTPNTSGASGRKGRHPRRIFFFLAFLLAVAFTVHHLSCAWRETVLREADLPQLEAMAQRDAYNGRLHALLGARLAEAREFAAAATALEKAVALGEQDEAVYLTWAAAAAAAGDPVKARAVLRLGMRHPHLEPRLRVAFERSLVLGPAPAPDALANSICPQGTALLIASRTKGSFLNGLMEWWGRRHPEKSGFATRERWAREQPRNVKVQQLWAEALVRHRRWTEAEQVARRVVKLNPKSPAAHRLLGDVLLREGATGKAGLAYMAALRLRRDWLPALIGLGNVAVEKKLLTMGVEVFERAVRQDAKSVDAWIGLGRAYDNQRINLSKSLEAFQTAARLAPHRTDFFPYYSDALRVNFRFAESEKVLRRRLADAPNDAMSHFLLATLLLEYKPSPERTKEAEKLLRASLRLEPQVPAVEAKLGDLLLRRGKAADAVPLLQSALEGDPYNVVAMTALVRAYRRLGRAKEAQEAQQKLDWLSQYTQKVAFLEDQAKRQPLNAEVHQQLAKLFDSGGEPEKAQREYEMAHMLRTRPQDAMRGIETLEEATAVVGKEP